MKKNTKKPAKTTKKSTRPKKVRKVRKEETAGEFIMRLMGWSE